MLFEKGFDFLGIASDTEADSGGKPVHESALVLGDLDKERNTLSSGQAEFNSGSEMGRRDQKHIEKNF